MILGSGDRGTTCMYKNRPSITIVSLHVLAERLLLSGSEIFSLKTSDSKTDAGNIHRGMSSEYYADSLSS